MHYAMKANPYAPLLIHMAGQVDGLDVASGGELKAALASGMAAARRPADAETCQATFARAVRRPILAAEAIRRIAARPMLANGLLRVMTGWPGLAGRIAHISRIEGY